MFSKNVGMIGNARVADNKDIRDKEEPPWIAEYVSFYFLVMYEFIYNISTSKSIVCMSHTLYITFCLMLIYF